MGNKQIRNSNPKIIHLPVRIVQSDLSPHPHHHQPPIPEPHQNPLPQNDDEFTKATNKKEDREQTSQTLLKQLDSKPNKTKKKKGLFFRERFASHRIRIKCRFSEPQSVPEITHRRRRRLRFHSPVWPRNWVPNPHTSPRFVHVSIICIFWCTKNG